MENPSKKSAEQRVVPFDRETALSILVRNEEEIQRYKFELKAARRRMKLARSIYRMHLKAQASLGQSKRVKSAFAGHGPEIAMYSVFAFLGLAGTVF